MLNRNQIVITDLEEDFRQIGILPKLEGKGAEPKADPAPAPASTPPDGEVDEARRIKKQTRDNKVVRTKRTSARDRRAGKKYRRSSAGKKSAKKSARMMKKSTVKRRKARQASRAIAKGTRQETVEPVSKDELLKSFANAAIIAEKLSDFFGEYAEACEEAGISLSVYFEEISELLAIDAEVFAGVASSLHEGAVTDFSGLAEEYESDIEYVLEAVQVYDNLMAEASEEDEDEDEDEDEEEEAEEATQPGN